MTSSWLSHTLLAQIIKIHDVIHSKAAQRGLKATAQLLQGLLDGVDNASNGPVYVVDLMPSKLLRSIIFLSLVKYHMR